MLQNDLTKYEVARFKKNRECKICGLTINDNEPFEMIKHKSGKCVNYAFIHTRCLFAPTQVKRNVNLGDFLTQQYFDREEIPS